jgi:mono/diheme cytochrome c family protein
MALTAAGFPLRSVGGALVAPRCAQARNLPFCRQLVLGLALLLAPIPFLRAATSNTVIVPPKEDTALGFDATAKEYVARPGEESCTFHFLVMNTSDREVVINQVRTSCGCTVATLPEQPWHLAPGAQGDLTLTVDLRGKSGEVVKTATIDTPTTFKTLLIKVTMPAPDAIMAQNRDRNVQLAKADRQAVFKGECAACHAAPAAGRLGSALYVSACSICHDAAHRATMVPDLHALNRPADATFWRSTIAHGRDGTLMPAFAQADGGPLTKAQIDSLVTYLTTEFSHRNANARKE